MKLIVAGYTASPSDPQDRLVYYRRLMSMPDAQGLEFGWNGPGAEADLADVLDLLPETWSVTLNDITGTFRASVVNPRSGLASPDEDGRTDALNRVRSLAASVKAINAAQGRQAVLAVEIHSAPGFSNRILQPQLEPFARSLAEVAELDFDGAEVLVEHCDAFVVGQTPAKGFLSLDAEIAALRSVAGSPLGLGINWGRSLLELRDADRVVEHIDRAMECGLLRAVTFSGTGGVDNEYGVAWADSHLPFADTTDHSYSAAASLMTRGRVRDSLAHLADWRGSFIAAKTQWPATRTDPSERAASVEANFATLTGLIGEAATEPSLQLNP